MSQRYLGGVITANPTTPTMTTESGVWTLEQQFQYSNVWSPEIIGNSLRFRSSASAYLNRTPASASNRQKWTWSGWVKRGTLTRTYLSLFSATPTVANQGINLGFDSSVAGDNIVFSVNSVGTATSVAKYRDPSAWYHIVLALDTTQAVAANRAILYVNGVQVAFDSAPWSQNASYAVNNNVQHNIGYTDNPSAAYFDGYMAEVYLVDGQALTPSSFGAFDSNGVWQPLPYTGTFGTNGFYVDFSDNSGTTSTTLGKDYSGNGNNWTPNNFSLTAGVTYDWMLDTPTNSDNGGTGRGNYCVINPIDKNSSVLVTDGNLAISSSSGAYPSFGSIVMDEVNGWYAEFLVVSNDGVAGPVIGIADVTTNAFVQQDIYVTKGVAYLRSGTVKKDNATVLSGLTTLANGNILSVAYKAGKVWFAVNGTWQNSGDPAAGTGQCATASTPIGGYVFATNGYSGAQVAANFGQRPFAYTPPTGFKALNTQNMPAVNITNGAKYMAATTYTGTGVSNTLSNGANTTTNVSFKPDFAWIKSRSNVDYHVLVDSVRGVSLPLSTNAATAEGANSFVTSFNSNGVTLAANISSDTYYTNVSGYTFVNWQWQAGQGVTSSNTNGSITSTTSVNTTAGFSVVGFALQVTGSKTVGHGLNTAPAFIIVKSRTAATDWFVYHQSLGATKYILMDSTGGAGTSSTVWDNTAPTSSVFTMGSGFVSGSYGTNQIAYCWSEVAGYSKFGSYTGNGSADGPFVYCGFRPRWVMIKDATTAGYDWQILDTSRDTYNVEQNILYPNLSSAEAASASLDITSNGFKIRTTGLSRNNNGDTYIFAAFAENPFNISRAR